MNKTVNVGKEILKAFAKTILIFAIVLAFACLGFYVINPRGSANFCAEMGWQKLEISCYELLYARNKDTSDLYNLIVKLGNTNKYKKQNEYIDKLQAEETYNEFCESMDTSVIDGYKAGSIAAENLAVLYGTNEYLYAREIINLINLEKYDDAYNLVKQSKELDKAYELIVYNYAEYLYASDIAADIKTNYFAQLDTDIADYLLTREGLLISGVSAEEQILSAYLKLKIEYTQYLIALNNNYADVNDYYNAWQNARNAYNELI